jgi:hypothetical protein
MKRDKAQVKRKREVMKQIGEKLHFDDSKKKKKKKSKKGKKETNSDKKKRESTRRVDEFVEDFFGEKRIRLVHLSELTNSVSLTWEEFELRIEEVKRDANVKKCARFWLSVPFVTFLYDKLFKHLEKKMQTDVHTPPNKEGTVWVGPGKPQKRYMILHNSLLTIYKRRQILPQNEDLEDVKM